MRFTTLRRALLSLTTVLLVATGMVGCSANSPPADDAAPSPAPTVTVTATETVEADPSPNAGVLRADSLTDFRDQLVDQGLECDDWQVSVDDFSGSCDDLLQLTWADPSDTKQDELYQATLAFAWTALREQERSDVGLLLGSNCFIRLSTEDAKTLQERVGGVVLHG